MCLGGEDRFIHLHEHLHVAHSATHYRKRLILARNKFYSLAHLRQLVGWGVHQHAAVSCPQAAQPETVSLQLCCIQSVPEPATEIWKDIIPSLKGL